MWLNNEKAKFEEFKVENSKDLELERTTRAKYEDMVLKLKEELMRKDVEINKLTTDYEIKVSEIEQEKADVVNDNKLITEKLERIRGTYDEKYRVLEGSIFTKNRKLQKKHASS